MKALSESSKPRRWSQAVLALCVSVVVLAFGSFWLWGTADDDDVLTDVLLFTVYALLAFAVGLTLLSAVRGMRLRSVRDTAPVQPLLMRRMGWGIALLLVITLAVTYLTASTTPLLINGQLYTHAFWLRMADMFIHTAFIFIFLAFLGLAFGLTGLSRKLPRLKK